MSPERVARASRKIEDAGLVLGLVLMGLYGVAEFVIYVAVSLNRVSYVDVPAPKIIILVALMCVLPKYLGRATAGQIWIALAAMTSRAIPWGKNGGSTTLPSIAVEAKCGNCGNVISACICPD